MRLYKTLLAGLAAAAAFILPGDFSARKPETPTAQNGLEQILNSDSIEETLVQDKFESLTEADKATLNCLIIHSEQYYKKVDEIIAEEKTAQIDKLNLLFCQQVANPVFSQIYRNNEELKQFFIKKFGEKSNLNSPVAMQALDDYFKKKGHRIRYLTTLIDCGLVSSCNISEIDRITQIKANLWGVNETRQAYYLREILPDYRARYEKDTVRAGESDDKNDVFIYYKEYDRILNRWLELSKTSTDKISNGNDLFSALLAKGLQGLNDGKRTAFLESQIKGTQIHEMAHVVYGRIYGLPGFDNPQGAKKTEIFATLTELQHTKEDSIYCTLATICLPSSFVPGQASGEILSLFLSEMYNNKTAYPNISFERFDVNRQNVDVLISQLIQLSAEQLRELAAKSFAKSFPEAGKVYIPQLPEK